MIADVWVAVSWVIVALIVVGVILLGLALARAAALGDDIAERMDDAWLEQRRRNEDRWSS